MSVINWKFALAKNQVKFKENSFKINKSYNEIIKWKLKIPKIHWLPNFFYTFYPIYICGTNYLLNCPFLDVKHILWSFFTTLWHYNVTHLRVTRESTNSSHTCTHSHSNFYSFCTLFRTLTPLFESFRPISIA